jgi:flagellar basal-body rod modification protein FlgD
MSMIAAASTVPSTPAAPAAANPNGAAAASGFNQLANTQTFLQLLVAQLKNQDPTNPTDPTQFMTEIAQMTAVQSQSSLNAVEQTVAADSMIGKTITGMNSTGTAVSGLVNGVLLSSAGVPALEIGSGASAQVVSLSSISQVTAAYGSAASADPPASAASSSSA